MKRILLTMMLVFVGMTAWAQNWVEPEEGTYYSSTPVYVQVNVNGVEQMKVMVAAFIDGDCRAVSYGAEVSVGNSQYHLLRVWGDASTELNKDITFKVSWNGLIFNFTKTAKFTGETHGEIPFVLNVDIPTGVVMPNPLNIETKLPGTYNLTNDISFEYKGMDFSGATVDYTPQGESSIETELTYEWDFANSASYFTVEGMTLNALQATSAEGMYLGLMVSGGDGFMVSTNTNVAISEPVVPVTSISCSVSEWTMNITDNLYQMQELNDAITVLPNDASDKSFSFVPADATAEAMFEGGSFSMQGTYNMKIVANSDASIFTTLKVTVVVPVESISFTSPSSTFYAVVGDNVYDLITPYVSVYPYEATNKDFHYEIPAEASDAIVNGVAEKYGQYTVYVVSDENESIRETATVIVNAVVAPQSITMSIGESYNDILQGKITVEPVLDSENYTYSIVPKTDADKAAFDGIGYATTAGDYILLVVCDQNPNATAEINVKVITPVRITYPSSLTLSKFKDTKFELTLEEGDDFNPELVEIYVMANNDVMPGLPEPITYTATNANNLEWTLRANLVGFYQISVSYNGENMLNEEGTEFSNVVVPVEIAFNNNGWDWIYYPGTYSLKTDDGLSYLDWLNQDNDNRIIDLRSQTDLLYNDATFGLFGSIDMLTSRDGMYKIKASYENELDAIIVNSEGDMYWESNSGKTIKKGYNWIGYPNEWDITIEDFNTINGNNLAEDGDLIIGKSGFAEYDGTDGIWVAQDGFYLQAGKGYIYYSTSEEDKDISFDVYPSEPEANARTRGANSGRAQVWQYDAGAFADNMAIVAEIAGLENAENYSIGAFVDGECRGAGNFVNGSKMMISVAGKAGETVSFSLYNHQTGEYSDVQETVKYAQKLGSLRKPMAFSAPEATGIEGVIESADMVSDAQIFDINGRRVENMTASGLYIVKTIEGGKTVTKKVIKR